MPPESLYKLISKILPDCTSLGYIFYPSLTPDLFYKAAMQKSAVPEGMVIDYIDLTPNASIPSKYLKKCQVFLGWYGLYKYQRHLSDQLPDKVFIGTNISRSSKAPWR